MSSVSECRQNTVGPARGGHASGTLGKPGATRVQPARDTLTMGVFWYAELSVGCTHDAATMPRTFRGRLADAAGHPTHQTREPRMTPRRRRRRLPALRAACGSIGRCSRPGVECRASAASAPPPPDDAPLCFAPCPRGEGGRSPCGSQHSPPSAEPEGVPPGPRGRYPPPPERFALPSRRAGVAPIPDPRSLIRPGKVLARPPKSSSAMLADRLRRPPSPPLDRNGRSSVRFAAGAALYRRRGPRPTDSRASRTRRDASHPAACGLPPRRMRQCLLSADPCGKLVAGVLAGKKGAGLCLRHWGASPPQTPKAGRRLRGCPR